MEPKFEDVYKKYFPSVYRYLLSLTKNSSLAEELTEETFYKALKNINKYNPNYPMFSWLCTIAKNTYYTIYQKIKN